MPAHEGPLLLLLALTPFPPVGPWCLLAYVGLGPGQEFIPYFLALLGFVGALFVAVVQWPAAVVLRFLRRLKNAAGKGRKDERTKAEEPEPRDQDSLARS